MPAEIVDEFRPLPPAQIIGASDHSQWERRRQTHRYHISLGAGRAEYPASNTLGGDIDQIRARGDLHLDVGICLGGERRKKRFQQYRYDRPRRCEPQQSGRPLPKVTGNFACGDKFLESGLCSGMKSLAGFAQAEALPSCG